MSKSSSSLAFCLEYNNHKNDMIDAFDDMLKSETMVDVILSCQGRTIKAHRMILSAGSPYFRNIFSAFTNPLHYPVVIIKDMPFSDLKAIVDFLYRGEVVVPVEQVSSLSKSAQTLLIKGLEKYFNKSAIIDVEGHDADCNDDDSPPLEIDTFQKTSVRKRRRKRQSSNSKTDVNGNVNGVEDNGNTSEETFSDEEQSTSMTSPRSKRSGKIMGTIKTEHLYDINYINADYDDEDGPPALEQMQLENYDNEEEGDDDDNTLNESEESNPKQSSSASGTRMISFGPNFMNTSSKSLQRTTSKGVEKSLPPAILTNSLQEPRGLIKNPLKVAPRKVKTPFVSRQSRKKKINRKGPRPQTTTVVTASGSNSRNMPLPIKTDPDGYSLIHCTICPKVFSQMNSLNIHMKRVHGDDEKEHCCDICGKKYSWRSGLYKHLRIHR